ATATAAMAGAALARAAQLWALLDEMAENDPQAYRRFLRQQRAEAERVCAAPEPHLCLRARVGARAGGLGPSACCWHWVVGGGPLFINICSWKRVPAPKAPTEPTPVSVGRLEEVSAVGDLYRVIDIAYNPDVLQRGESPAEMEHLIQWTLKLIEERCSLVLPCSYTVEPFKLKGSLNMMQQRLGGRQRSAPQLSQNTEKGLTLDQLFHTVEAEDCSNSPVLLKEGVTQPRKQLIEEISSPEVREKPTVPVHEIITVRDAEEKPLQIQLTVQLPEVGSVSECDLSISKDDLIVEVPEKYKLQLDLPELVDEEGATAVFKTGTGVLFVTLPVAKTGP
ncbi:PIHD2 protein, partial [Ramphastos sulfuratus]|nr:PIHD2 protein [Ramphastos sulfuratus]